MFTSCVNDAIARWLLLLVGLFTAAWLEGRFVFGWLLQPRRMESPFWPIPKTQIEGKQFVVSQVLFKLCGSSTGTGDGEETLTFVGGFGRAWKDNLSLQCHNVPHSVSLTVGVKGVHCSTG